jgi:VanZ family protein
MISNFSLRWSRLLGVGAFGMVIFASLMLPTAVEHMRTGHWFIEHFLGYFAASAVLCLGWRRPFWVAGILTVAAFLLEGLQALTPNHSANLLSVLGGASGAWLAALIVAAIGVASKRASG